MTVNKERVELWVQALESDGFKQCQNVMHVDDKHCALGVAVVVALANGVQV